MFGLFKKDPSKSLLKKHDKLMGEAFLLSRTNRRQADQKYTEADLVKLQIEALKNVS